MLLLASLAFAISVVLFCWWGLTDTTRWSTHALEGTVQNWQVRLGAVRAGGKKALRGWAVARLAVIGVGAPLVFVTLNPLLAIGIAAAACFAPPLILDTIKERYHRSVARQLPDAVSMLVASFRAQGSLVPAIKDVALKMNGPIAREFQSLYRDIDVYGLEVGVALVRARARMPVEGLTMVLSALIVSLKQGGDLLVTLESIAAATRTLSELREKIFAETAGLRAEARFALFAMPAFIVFARLIDSEAWNVLFGTLGGNLLLAVAVALQCLAWLQIRNILRTFF